MGDVLSAASFLAYSGPFNQEYRALLAKKWLLLLVEFEIPRTEQLSVLTLMADTSEVGQILAI